ncbi:hypothetical protein PILCRDRAFT_816842 [Piloderma croceum F 1598]|uniref:Protein kinase domain-containing protein n=1 Tax=Piloderma croceum (strain F 1598) TaxID=765440 RepID=A0A0C3FP63_PILCF|nr:hypothetical protein PILCRDRAFT_816842 [Piloderma croceum F 1598]
MEHLTPAYFGLEPLNLGKLTLQEEFWCDHQKWLQDCGYMLRPRYMLDWQLSWPVDVRGMEYEDAQPLIRALTINDTTRLSDGAYVTLKIIKPSLHPYKVDTAMSLCLKQLTSDPLNHCVPIYNVLKLPEDNDKVILVMPLLRGWHELEFEMVREGIYFFQQIFEDILILNVLMDGSMYPDRWHPCNRRHMQDNFRLLAKHFSHTEHPPKYYFIDFGISCWYGPDNKAPLELPIRNYVGNLIREAVINEYKDFDFMWPLISDMVQDDLAKCPTIDQVVKHFADMCKKLGILKLHAYVGRRDESFGVVHDFVHLFTTIKYTLMGIPPVPTQ